MIFRRRSGPKWLRGFGSRTDGAAAVEFAMVVVPFLIFLFGLLEMGLMFFVNASFDAALTRAARQVRTGQAQQAAMTIGGFRTAVCSGLLNLFDCSNQTYFTVAVISNLNSVTYTNPIDSSGNVSITQTFNPGAASDFMLVRGYLHYKPLFNVFGVLHAPMSDGGYLFVATALFRNEPF
ncbi:TadE/TadG family type IV pilus assembly protein [Devosia sp.]|uniref:TadE/TadG family type IV pilus assembly protein n=1 Tax=Devosia sp. TaxID=1871048 RepID=UPI00326711C2